MGLVGSLSISTNSSSKIILGAFRSFLGLVVLSSEADSSETWTLRLSTSDSSSEEETWTLRLSSSDSEMSDLESSRTSEVETWTLSELESLRTRELSSKVYTLKVSKSNYFKCFKYYKAQKQIGRKKKNCSKYTKYLCLSLKTAHF